MLGIKNRGTGMKNSFDGLIKRLDMANERINKLEDISVETSQTEMQRKKDEKKKKTRISKSMR